MGMDCIFCKIIAGDIPSPRVFENAKVIAIRDIHPQAPHHFLLMPKRHVASLEEAFHDEASGRDVVADLFSAAAELAKREGLSPEGFRSVINTGLFGGQTVFHLHLHLLGGEKMKGSFA